MKQIKRKNSIANGNKKKQATGDTKSLSKNSTARFEDLSNKIIYKIFLISLFFSYIYEIFSNLNIRFQNLLTYPNFPLKIKLLSTSKSTFQRYHTQIIIPNQHRIKSLYLSNPFIIDGDSNQPEQLPIATKGSSPIEHFILNSTHVLNDLNNLLSYVPHLNRLSIHSSYYFSITQIQLYSASLIHLTHVSLNRLDIPFNQLKFMIQSLFNQVQVLHISNYYRLAYLDALR
ncbi:unnamed protein product [Rotaria sordida]|uniref:Uncharacterized protein n=1 Tax=Rotaria sordida TaxID=392033 RepID=A0A815M206_9BILA|nr:unnamed protein product [Rotaria sordida]CAF1413371.1 unnamed protein product [Rotaria sordida]